MPTLNDLVERFPALQALAIRRTMRRRMPDIHQTTAADCGVAALAMVLGYHGKRVTVRDLNARMKIGRDGVSAASLLDAADDFGLRGRAVRVADVRSLPLASILHWQFRHFLVLRRHRRDAIEVSDPAFGRRVIPLSDVRRAFTGVALVFEPTDRFVPGTKVSSTRRGFRILLSQRTLFGRIVVASLLAQMLATALPFFTGLLVDRVVPRQDYSLLLVLSLGLVIIHALTTLTSFIRAHLMLHLRTRLETVFTLGFLDHLVGLPYGYFQRRTSGDLMVKLGANATVREILTSTMMSTLLDGLLSVIYLVVLFLTNWRLTFIVLFLAAGRLTLLWYVRWRQRQLVAESLDVQSRSQTYQVEMLSGMETLKSMGLERRAAEIWSNVFVDGLNVSIRRGQLDATFSALLALMGVATSVTLLSYGGYLVLEGVLSLGMLIAFTALASAFLAPLNGLVSSAIQLQMLEVYVERVNDVLETPHERAHVTTPVKLSGPIQMVRLEHVHFRYADGRDVLTDISLDIARGTRVAIVGQTGSGKTTLARLLAGLYDPTQGRVLFNDHDLRNLDVQSLRRRFGIVTQETQLFGGTIRSNIALSDPDMGLDRIVMAAKVACLHEEILAMPMAYETVLADRGLSLSGGQRQRLAIARAVASNPEVLVLDEATSHLDVITEARINENLAALACIMVVISHRLSSIQAAHVIAVLQSGRIADVGTHDQLLSRSAIYGDLVRAQRDNTSRT